MILMGRGVIILPDIVELGPLMIRGSLLILLLSCLAGFVHLYIKLRKSSLQQSPIGDLILNGILIVIMSWKFGSLVYEPSMLWKEPIKLLMVSGTVDIAVFGGVITVAYWSTRLRKLGISWLVMLDALAYLVTGATLLYSLLTPTYGLTVISIACVIFLWSVQFTIGEGSASRYTFIILGLGGLLVSLLTEQPIVAVFLSGDQIVYILIALLGIAISPKEKNWIDES